MASRFWVGGGASANWAITSPTNWAATSGGTGNQTVPGATDDVIFDGAGAGNGISVIAATITVLSFTVTSGYTSTMTFNANLTVAGNISLGANMTIAGTSSILSSAAGTLTSNGKTWPNGISILTAGATRTFADAWNITGTLSANIAVTITLNGLLTANQITLSNGISQAVTFAGTFGFSVNTLLFGGVLIAISLTLANTITYTVITSFTINQGAAATKATLTSDHATNKAILVLREGATCNCNANLTRIDASGGRAVNTYNGTVTDCLNVNSFNDIFHQSVGMISSVSSY